MVLKYKYNLIFLTVILALILSLSGCTQADNQTNNNQNQANSQPVATSSEEERSYQGELIQEEDGWKKYVNQDWGIEFRFSDDENLLNAIDLGDRIVIGRGENSVSIQTNPYIYISVFDLWDKKKYPNFEDYVEYAWNGYQQPTALIAIKKIINNNNISFYKIEFNIKGMGDDQKYYYHEDYYLEFNKITNKNFLVIRSTSEKNIILANQIISSFNFLK